MHDEAPLLSPARKRASNVWDRPPSLVERLKMRFDECPKIKATVQPIVAASFLFLLGWVLWPALKTAALVLLVFGALAVSVTLLLKSKSNHTALFISIALVIAGQFRQQMDEQQIAALTSIIDDAHSQVKNLKDRASSLESTAHSLALDLPATSDWRSQATDIHADAESVERKLRELMESLNMELVREKTGAN